MNKTVRKILIGTTSVFAFLVVVLVIHIYVVTRPKAPTEHTRAMARIDFKQHITQEDADKVTAWLYQQKGVDHVLINPKTDIAVFSFFPIKTTADQVVSNFKAAFNYKAERYVPTEAEIQSGCPIASNSAGYMVYNFVKHIF